MRIRVRQLSSLSSTHSGRFAGRHREESWTKNCTTQCGNWGSRRQGAATVNRFFVGGALKFTVASYFWLIHPSLSYSLLCSLKDKGSPYTRLPSVGFWSWSRYLAVSLQVTWVINPAVGCHYFSPGLQLRTQPLRGLLPIWLLDERMGVNSLPKTVTRQRRGCDLNPGPYAPESSTLTTRLPSHLCSFVTKYFRSSCVAPPMPAASGATPPHSSLATPLQWIHSPCVVMCAAQID